VFAQAGEDIIPCGTTHADYFYGFVPCTRNMSVNEISHDYESNTGKVIVETFKKRKINPLNIPAVLVNDHGPFVWGNSCEEAVENAIILEEVAKIAFHTHILNDKSLRINSKLLDKHFLRKHGKNAYYGQKKK
jgi:L-ribulose-5-phosphate 4-epimerase